MTYLPGSALDDGPLGRLLMAARQLSHEPPLLRRGGQVTEISPAACRVRGLSRFAALGDCVEIGEGTTRHLAQVVHVGARGILVKPFEAEPDIRLGQQAWHQGAFRLHPDEAWKGRIVNALGEPADGAGPLPPGLVALPVDRPPPRALRRQPITQPMRTGVRAVDIFTPICAGQRMGIFAGSGVGKSTFLAMLTRAADFDTVIFALIGERGREVREFVEETLDEKQRRNAIGVVATGDESPMMRRLALKTAITIAEYFRDRGENVLLVADSITRYAHACRDILLAAGEAPVARGYPPGIFAELPRLLERAGPGEVGGGSITGFFSVLVDGDDHNDPVADSIRGILDGHIVLDREIAEQGRYPAMNVLASVSRLARRAWTPEQEKLVLMLRALIARFEDTRDLRLLGGYRPGTDEELDRAVQWVPSIYEVLRQAPDETEHRNAFETLSETLKALAAEREDGTTTHTPQPPQRAPMSR